MTRKEVGLLGGTFDPIHNGHLNLAFEVLEKAGLDEIWFVPNYMSPCKTDEPPISDIKRLEMLKLTIDPIDEFKISTIELEQKKTCYTFDTVTQIMKEHLAVNFSLILSEDFLLTFSTWYQYAKLIEIIPIIIGRRFRSIPNPTSENQALYFELKKKMIDTSIFEISSTQVRMRLKKKLSCVHFVPGKVLDYIYNHKLY